MRMSTDIQDTGWIRRLPEKYRPYAVLARLDRPVGIWLLLLPALWSIFLAAAYQGGLGFYAVVLMVLFTIGAVAMRGAGCVINDLWDRKLDAQVERTKLRPLASGEITIENALIFLSILLMIGLIVLLLLEPTAIMLGILVVPLIVLYPFTKRLTYWPQAVLGITFNFGALMGWAAMTDSVGLAALFLYIGGVFWTLGYDTVYAHQDKEDDVLIGIKSTALLFAGESKMFVTGFYGVALFCIFMAMVFSGVSLFAYIGLIAAGVHLGWQIMRWVPDNPENSLKVFKSNRDFGLIVFATCLIAAILA
jgi:4-hydroxybenzoate polyprenyltransferase